METRGPEIASGEGLHGRAIRRRKAASGRVLGRTESCVREAMEAGVATERRLKRGAGKQERRDGKAPRRMPGRLMLWASALKIINIRAR